MNRIHRYARVSLRLSIACTALWSLAAPAADNGFYLGAAYSEPSTDYDFSFAPGVAGGVDDDSGFKLIGGIRPLDSLGIEFNYVDFGSSTVALALACLMPPCGDHAVIEASALSASVIGFKTLPLLDLYGRVGIARWETDGAAPYLPYTTSADGSDVTFGVGLQFRFQSAAIRVEYESFDLGSDSSELLSIGFTYTFL